MKCSMNRTTIAILLASLIASDGTVRAQVAQPSQTKSDATLEVPPTQAAQSAALSLGSQGRESALAGGVSLTALYTNNIFLTASNHQGNVSYELMPYLAWRQFSSRMSLHVGGGAGLVVNQYVRERNTAAENFNINLSYRLRQYVTLRFDDSFLNTSGLFSGRNPSSASIGVVQQANSTLISPASHILTNSSLAELTYPYRESSNLGVRGVVSILRYPGGAETITNIPLFEGQSYEAEFFYNHRATKRQWIGAALRVQRFDSYKSLVITDSGSLLLFYSLQPSNAINISFFAGPQLSNSRVAPAVASTLPQSDFHHLTPATGATFSWQKNRTSADVSFVRQVSDGAGLFSAVINESIQAGWRRQLSDRQQVSLSFTYGGNETTVPGVTLHGYSGGIDYSRRLTAALSAGLGYRFEQQGIARSNNPARANRCWISLAYEFSRPLGR